MADEQHPDEMKRRVIEGVSKKFADEGKLIEAGWVAMKLSVLPQEMGEQQERDMRMAFMAGAQHLFASIMAVMEDDHEPTETDLKRMDLIHAELEAFRKELEAAHKMAGRA